MSAATNSSVARAAQALLNDMPGRAGARRVPPPSSDPKRPTRADAQPSIRPPDTNPHVADALPGSAGRVVAFSELTTKPVEWVWRHRLPVHTLTLIEGPPGIGKSTVVFDLLARITRGHAFPDGTPSTPDGRPGRVLVIGPEDDAERVLRPRLEAAGADLTRALLYRHEATDDGARLAPLRLPRDAGLFETKLTAYPDVQLVYLDALDELLVDLESKDTAGTKDALRPLVHVAERRNVAILAARHFSKGGHRSAVFAGAGSLAFAATARSVLQVYRDPDASSQLLLSQAKSNWGPLAPSLRFSLEVPSAEEPGNTPAEAFPRVLWGGADDRSADDLQATYRDEGGTKGRRDTQQTRCETWLADALADGPQPKLTVLMASEGAGFSKRTVERAAVALQVVTTKGFGQAATWALQERAPASPPGCPSGETGENGAHPRRDANRATSPKNLASGENGEVGETDLRDERTL